MRNSLLELALLGFAWSGHFVAQTTTDPQRSAMLARAKAAEISDAWTPLAS
jgi:hypothetical protein